MSMTFTSNSVSGLDVFDDVAHGLAQVLVVLHVPFHGLEGAAMLDKDMLVKPDGK